MKISQETITGAHQIRDYGDGFLLIQLADGQMQRLTGSFILSSEQLQFSAPNFIEPTHIPLLFSTLESFEYDVLIVVTNEHMNANTALLMQEFRSAGLAAEFMDLGPACRTFNLLMAEGRKPLICASL
ncbi:MAG TPA: Mth938-like domain-containing protein [Methylophaga sp.]|nr:Mth938-like domain-containing protein [Methylophaga sp.]